MLVARGISQGQHRPGRSGARAGPELVRGIRRELTLPLKRCVEPVEHRIKRPRQTAHLVIPPSQVEPPRQVAGSDLSGSLRNPIDRVEGTRGQEDADRDGEEQRGRDADDQQHQ